MIFNNLNIKQITRNNKTFHIARRAFSNEADVILAIGFIIYFLYNKFGGGKTAKDVDDKKLENAQKLLEEQDKIDKINQYALEVHELEEANRYFGLIRLDPGYRRVLDGLKKIYLYIEENFNALIPDFLESSRILNAWDAYCTFGKLLCLFEGKNLESLCNIVFFGLQQQLYNGLTGKILTALFFFMQIPDFETYLFLYDPHL